MSTTTEPQAAAAPETLTKYHARTGEALYSIEAPSDEALRGTMQRARDAAATVRAMSVAERVAEVDKLRRYFVDHAEELVAKLVAENGKCETDALVGDVWTVLDLIHYYMRNSEKMLADEKVETPLLMLGKQSKIIYSPLGVVLVISPWNYPINTAITPALCAFLAGNSVIIKPSEATPMHGLLDTALRDSGFMPEGMQVVMGGRDTGRKLIDLRPDKVFFTGSVRAGKEIMAQAAAHLTAVELELGGKDPMIVFDDCNLERTLNGATWGVLNNTGQGCTSIERAFVQRGIYDRFVARLKDKFGKLSTTDTQAEDGGTLDIGAITVDYQLAKIKAQVDEARAQGAAVWQAYEPRDSNNYPPTIITQVTPEMAVQCEETFGPVVTVVPFDSEAEAIRLANDTVYGLSSSVWTNDLEKADRVARAIDAGNVCVNDVMITEGNSALPFGGVKQSGIGRYKGRVGLHNFCNIKSVMVDPAKKDGEINWYPYNAEKYQAILTVLRAYFGRGGLVGLLHTAWMGLKIDSFVKRTKL